MLALPPALVLYRECVGKVWVRLMSILPLFLCPTMQSASWGTWRQQLGVCRTRSWSWRGSHLRERLDTVRAKKVGEGDAYEQLESSVSTSGFEAKGCDGGAVMLRLQDVAWMRKLLDGPHQGSQLRGPGHCAGHRAGWQSEGVCSAGRLFITLQESAAPLCSAVALSCWGLPL